MHPNAYLAGNVTLGENVSIWPGAILRGDVNAIRIGSGSNIQDGTVIHVRGDFPGRQKGLPTVIGANVTIGHRVTLHGCEIEDGCLIGIGAIVLDGSVVREGTLVAAGGLVPPGKVLDGGLWVGSPVRRLRDLTEDEKSMLTWNSQHYIELSKVWKKNQSEGFVGKTSS